MGNEYKFTVIGRVDLNVLYDQWKRQPVTDGYTDPKTGWVLKCAYAFEKGVGALLFECCPDPETAYYHFCFYRTEAGAFRPILKVRRREKEGARIDAIGIDESLETLFLRRKGPAEKNEIVYVSLDEDDVENDRIAARKKALCEDDETFAIIDNSVVLFVSTPKDVYLDNFFDDYSPQNLFHDYNPEKSEPANNCDQDGDDDTACKVKPVEVPKRADRTAMEELQALVGLQNIKQQTEQIVAFAKMQKIAKEKGKKVQTVNLNLAFTGNPGTAKTTAARIFARVMKENGILSKGDLLEVGRADVVAKYVGQTAIKVKELFAKAKGNVLFIDEAYSLVDEWENSYGDEAIATIVQEMENHRDDVIVIFAGYPDKMQTFLSRNPGLRSRVPFVIEFDDYTAEELAEIAKKEIEQRGYTIEPAAEEKVLEICRDAVGSEDCGNGRFSRNLVDAALMRAAVRTTKIMSADDPTDDWFRLIADDFDEPGNVKKKGSVRLIGFHAA